MPQREEALLPTSWLEPSLLQSERLTLEPLNESHVQELVRILDPGIWQWYTIEIKDVAQLQQFLSQILREQNEGKSLAFAIRDRKTGELTGSSRFLNVDKANRRVEIGSTWLNPSWQRTFVNTEAKILMLTHAFETLECVCVQLQTDALNVQSRKAIERIGAKADGILRAHRICFDGRIRDSAVYSITAPEWPEVKIRLRKLAR